MHDLGTIVKMNRKAKPYRVVKDGANTGKPLAALIQEAYDNGYADATAGRPREAGK